jgi:hypothetical protein
MQMLQINRRKWRTTTIHHKENYYNAG